MCFKPLYMAGNILGISHNVYFVSDITISIIINIPKHYHFSTRKLRLMEVNYQLGLPSGAGGKETACQHTNHKRCELDPCLGKIPCRRAWQPAGVQPRWIQGDSKVGTESASLEKYIFNHRYRD